MSYEAWMLNAMEEKGYTDTEKGLNNRLVEAIDELDEDEIDTETSMSFWRLTQQMSDPIIVH